MAKKGKKYQEAAALIEKGKAYPIDEAVALVKKTSSVKFDASVDVAFKLGLDTRHADQQLRGAIVLPHGTGKTKKVLVVTQGAKVEEAKAAGADVVGGKEILEDIDVYKRQELDLYNIKKDWKIYTEDTLSKPQIIGEEASVKNSLITQGCIVNGEVDGSVLFNNVYIGEGAKVVDSVLMPGVLVEEGAEVYKAIVDEGVVIKSKEIVNKEAKTVELVSDNAR